MICNIRRKSSRYTLELRFNEEIQGLLESTNDDTLVKAFQKHFKKYKNVRRVPKNAGIFDMSEDLN